MLGLMIIHVDVNTYVYHVEMDEPILIQQDFKF